MPAHLPAVVAVGVAAAVAVRVAVAVGVFVAVAVAVAVAPPHAPFGYHARPFPPTFWFVQGSFPCVQNAAWKFDGVPLQVRLTWAPPLYAVFASQAAQHPAPPPDVAVAVA